MRQRSVALVLMTLIIFMVALPRTSAAVEYATGEPYIRWYIASPNTTDQGIPQWFPANSTFRITLMGKAGAGWFTATIYYGCHGLATAKSDGMTLAVEMKLMQLNYIIVGAKVDMDDRIKNYTAMGLNFTYHKSPPDRNGFVQADFSEWVYIFNASFIYHSPVSLSIQLGINETARPLGNSTIPEGGGGGEGGGDSDGDSEPSNSLVAPATVAATAVVASLLVIALEFRRRRSRGGE